MGATEIIVLIVIGLIAGITGGMFGLGGGLIVIPALVFFMGLTQHEAEGTNLAFMLAPVGLLATINYYKSGFVNIKYAVIIALAFVIGAYFGSIWALHLPANILKKAFGVMIILIGIKMIFGK
ncbi:MAG: permease [Bacteroidetes bacterium GWA2_32_17]|nr:MAG: permease [Bacteroidetes bacterium GWA2_32_17]